jgi:hypothetical protein
LEVEANENCNMGFSKIERLTVAMNSGGADIEVIKKGNNNVEIDQGNNMILWHVSNIKEEGNAVLSFASEKI